MNTIPFPCAHGTYLLGKPSVDIPTLVSDLHDSGLAVEQRRALILYTQHLDVPKPLRPTLAGGLQASALALDPTHDERYIWTALRCMGELAGDHLELFLPFLDSSRLTIRHVTLQVLHHAFERHPHVLSSPAIPELKAHVGRLLGQHLDDHQHDSKALRGELMGVAKVLGLCQADPV